jgi:type IV fimbrial biogenesis protein FimT
MLDRTPASRGHTLPELLTMLGITAVIAGSAVPVFSNLLLDSRMNAAVATAIHAVNLARQFSATRSEAIQLCGSDDMQDCSGRPDWSKGLLLADEGNRFRQGVALTGSIGAPRIRSNRSILSFEGGSGFATPATLTVCDRRGAGAARAVIISRSGRPRASNRDATDRALTC